jgi:hypothetical protein
MNRRSLPRALFSQAGGIFSVLIHSSAATGLAKKNPLPVPALQVPDDLPLIGQFYAFGNDVQELLTRTSWNQKASATKVTKTPKKCEVLYAKFGSDLSSCTSSSSW